MNTTMDSGGLLTDKINGFGYFIGVSVGIIVLICTIALASYFCNRSITAEIQTHRSSTQRPLENDFVAIEVGLDETTLQGYPTILYSQFKLDNKDKDTTTSCCSICLSDYKGTDKLRLLPECGHLFHIKCVDPWLRRHPTCPVCRNSPIPTPLSTPLAEVVPLASRSGISSSTVGGIISQL